LEILQSILHLSFLLLQSAEYTQKKICFSVSILILYISTVDFFQLQILRSLKCLLLLFHLLLYHNLYLSLSTKHQNKVFVFHATSWSGKVNYFQHSLDAENEEMIEGWSFKELTMQALLSRWTEVILPGLRAFLASDFIVYSVKQESRSQSRFQTHLCIHIYNNV
jgi:hypothetical protein